MMTFKEYQKTLDEKPEVLDEGFAKSASVVAFGIRHNSLKNASIQRLKNAAASASKVSKEKDTAVKLDLIADSQQDLAISLQHLAEMSGANISVSVIAALLSKDNAARSRRRR